MYTHKYHQSAPLLDATNRLIRGFSLIRLVSSSCADENGARASRTSNITSTSFNLFCILILPFDMCPTNQWGWLSKLK